MYGQSATVSGIKLSIGATQKTSARLAGAVVRAPATASTKKATPKPSASSAAPALESTETAAPVVAEESAATSVDLATSGCD